jgi:hypothetical protein
MPAVHCIGPCSFRPFCALLNNVRRSNEVCRCCEDSNSCVDRLRTRGTEGGRGRFEMHGNTPQLEKQRPLGHSPMKKEDHLNIVGRDRKTMDSRLGTLQRGHVGGHFALAFRLSWPDGAVPHQRGGNNGDV